MDQVSHLETVGERDVDLLVLEELCVSPTFRDWLLAEIWPEKSNHAFIGAWHSISEPVLGESDLIWVFADEQGGRRAVMIENKIGAPPQPDQAFRYLKRGEKGIRDNKWLEFKTMMLAPRKYLETDTQAPAYQARLSYEEVVSWMEESGDARMTYKASVFRLAIDQQRRGYVRNVDDQVTQFFADYWQTASREFPALGMKYPGGIPAGNDWIRFRPSGIHQKAILRHKLKQGVVHLEINADLLPLELPVAVWNSSNFERLDLVPVGKSGGTNALEMRVSPIDRTRSAEEQLFEIREALAAAMELVQIGQRLLRDGVIQ